MADFTTYGVVALEDLYVRRDADRDLCERLGRFEYCYVLAPRQMGKSSMALRAAEALRERGAKTVTIDLQPLAGHDSVLALWGLIARKLKAGLGRQGVDIPLFAPGATDEAPGALWVDYMRDVVLPRVDGGLVIFFDEVDTLVSCRFNTDPFFGSLRALHGERPAGQFAVCLLGVTRPADLVNDEKTTPFNVAHPIALHDFTRAESDAFLVRLRDVFSKPERIIDQAHAWTSGHPYMFQNVLKEASAHDRKADDPSLGAAAATAFVTGIVERRFFGQEEDAVLGVVRRNFEGQGLAPETMDALNHYRVLLADKDVAVAQGAKREVQEKLRITGLVAFVSEGKRTLLRVRNRIFRQRYDAAWVAGLLDRPIYEAMAARWLQEGEDEDFLLRGSALDAAEVWVKGQEKAVSGWTAEFVNASRRIEGRGTKKETTLVRLLAAVALALVLSGTLVVFAYTQRTEAKRQSLETQIVVLQAQKDANDASDLQYKKEIELLKTDRTRLDELVRAGNENLEILRGEHAVLKQKMVISSELEKKFLASQIRTNESRTAQVTDELERAKRALDASSRRATDLTGDIAQVQKKNQAAQEELILARKATSDLNTQLESLRSQVTQLSAKISDAQSRYATCTDELAKVRSEKDSALGARASCEAKAAQSTP
jgi:hypothetical protein